jgi:hypothetical protein
MDAPAARLLIKGTLRGKVRKFSAMKHPIAMIDSAEKTRGLSRVERFAFG